jgi:pentatricopeptide repeat protein
MLKEGQEGHNPNAIIFTALIDGHCKAGKMDEARKFFYEMPNKSICLDAVTYNALIDGFCKEGKLEEAMKLFH